MTEIEKAIRLVEMALALIDKQLEGHPDPLLVLVPREQLELFRADLEGMCRVLNREQAATKHLMSCQMARAVFHNWPFTILGNAIVKAERAFKKCQQNKDEQ